jgi:hypothetical protein
MLSAVTNLAANVQWQHVQQLYAVLLQCCRPLQAADRTCLAGICMPSVNCQGFESGDVSGRILIQTNVVTAGSSVI